MRRNIMSVRLTFVRFLKRKQFQFNNLVENSGSERNPSSVSKVKYPNCFGFVHGKVKMKLIKIPLANG